MTPSDSPVADTITFLTVLAVCLFFYIVPTMIAVNRHHRQRMAIGALNVILGWAIIGWVGALVWALTSDVEPDAG